MKYLILFIFVFQGVAFAAPFKSAISKERIRSIKDVIRKISEEEAINISYEVLLGRVLERYKSQKTKIDLEPRLDQLIADTKSWAAKKAKDEAREKYPSYSNEVLMVQAEKQYPNYVVGQQVEVIFAQNPSRPQLIKGKIKKVTGTHVKIGWRNYRLSDLKDQAFVDGLSVEKTTQNRNNYCRKIIENTADWRRDYIANRLDSLILEAIKSNEDNEFLWTGRKWLSGHEYLRQALSSYIKMKKNVVLEREVEAKKLASEKAQAVKEKKKKKSKNLLDWF